MALVGLPRARRLRRPAIWGNIRRRAPFSTHWGFQRGTPIDRVFIERWIEKHRALVRGTVLEVRDRNLVERFGSQLTRVDVLDIDPDNEIEVVSRGNAPTVLGVAAGTVLEEGFEKHLYPADPHYPLTICARVTHLGARAA